IGNGLAAARLAEARRLVERRCDHPGLDIHEIAAAMGASTRYLQRLFAGRGTTFTETLLECRLRRASRALLRPANAGKSIASIAFNAGFSDISYFNRRFKSRYGVSPRDYRHQHGGIGKAENWAANQTAGSTP